MKKLLNISSIMSYYKDNANSADCPYEISNLDIPESTYPDIPESTYPDIPESTYNLYNLIKQFEKTDDYFKLEELTRVITHENKQEMTEQERETVDIFNSVMGRIEFRESWKELFSEVLLSSGDMVNEHQIRTIGGIIRTLTNGTNRSVFLWRILSTIRNTCYNDINFAYINFNRLVYLISKSKIFTIERRVYSNNMEHIMVYNNTLPNDERIINDTKVQKAVEEVIDAYETELISILKKNNNILQAKILFGYLAASLHPLIHNTFDSFYHTRRLMSIFYFSKVFGYMTKTNYYKSPLLICIGNELKSIQNSYERERFYLGIVDIINEMKESTKSKVHVTFPDEKVQTMTRIKYPELYKKFIKNSNVKNIWRKFIQEDDKRRIMMYIDGANNMIWKVCLMEDYHLKEKSDNYQLGIRLKMNSSIIVKIQEYMQEKEKTQGVKLYVSINEVMEINIDGKKIIESIGRGDLGRVLKKFPGVFKVQKINNDMVITLV
jgi:hypothetical protein